MAIDDDPLASEWLGVLGLAGTQTLPKSCIWRAREPKHDQCFKVPWITRTLRINGLYFMSSFITQVNSEKTNWHGTEKINTS